MGQYDLGALMGIATTDPILGSNIPLSWGHAVYSDLAALSNITAVFNVPVTSPPYTNATTGYTSINGWSMAMTKQSNTSKLLVLAFLTSFMTTAAAQLVTWATLVDSTAYPTLSYYFNATADHRQVAGGVVIPNLTAGPKTLQLQGKLTTASGTLTADLNDRMTMIVLESP